MARSSTASIWTRSPGNPLLWQHCRPWHATSSTRQLVKQDKLNKAIKVLSENGVANGSARIVTELRKVHPRLDNGLLNRPSTGDVPQDLPTVDQLREAIDKRTKTKGPAPTSAASPAICSICQRAQSIAPAYLRSTHKWPVFFTFTLAANSRASWSTAWAPANWQRYTRTVAS